MPNCCLQRCGKKSKGFYNTQYQLTHHSVCMSARVCVWLLWPECCCVAGVRLVVPPGRHLTMGRKTPTIRVCPLPRCTSPPFIPLAMRLNNSLTAVCLPFVIGEAFAFAFCLCSSMCGEFFFLPFADLWKLCNIFNASGGFWVVIFILFCVFFCNNFSWVVRL